jgi:hypothetical protein
VHLDDERIVFWTDRGLATYPQLTLLTDQALSPDNRTLATAGVFDYAGSRYAVATMRGNVRQKAQRQPFIPLSVVTSVPIAANAKVVSSTTGALSP